MENSEDLSNMNDILTEKEVIDLLGVKRGTLDTFRYKSHLPFCRLTDRCRIYLVKDVLEFIKGHRVILNRGTQTQ